MAQSVSAFLISRLRDLNVQHVFGIPGDYVLPFFDHLIEEGSPIQHVGTCNELTAGYLADGYSRIRGFGVAAVTFGPGAFNAVNAVAGAYDACVPMLLVSGAPPTAEYQSGRKLQLHHSVGGDLSATLRVFTPITAAVARIDSAEEAVATIDRLLQVALDQKKPVYLEIPYNMQKARIPMPEPFTYQAPCGDQQVLRRVVDQVAAAVNKAKKVGVLVGLFVDRDGLEDVVAEMLERSNLLFATTFAQKAGYLEHLSNCVGCYQGATSPEVLDATEGADILLTIGMPRAEFDLLGSAGFKEECVIELGHDSVNLQGTVVPGIYLQQLLPCLAAQITPRAKSEVEDKFAFSYTRLPANPEQKPLTMDFMYQQLAHFVQEGDIVAGNTGGYVSMSRMRLKKGTVTAGPGNWGSLGSAFPISMGMAFAAPERRVVCLDGDGSFQMTGMELGTLLRHNLRFMLIILNNSGYTAERVIHPEREDSYNDIQVWNYHLLPEALGAGKGIGVEVSTETQLCEALTSYQGDGPSVLNAKLDKMDVPEFFQKMGDMLRH
ncbi:unnamed protein product [Effrenium voratum]|nr:unnamed protein product [Effrenium voratum]